MENSRIARKIISSDNPLKSFFLNSKYLDDSAYWTVLRGLWIELGTGNQSTFYPLFYCNRKRKNKLMKSSDRQSLKRLPKILTIYRACGAKEEEDNFNWTLSKDVATMFLKRKKYIVEKQIEKKEILAFFNSRDEYEIILKQKTL